MQKSGALRFLEASPPRLAFAEIRVAGFAAGRATREASLGVFASTRQCLPAWARNNPRFCNKNSFGHVHTSISGNFRILDGVRLAVIPAVSTLAGSLDRQSEYKKLRGTKHLCSNNHKNIQQKLLNINCTHNLDVLEINNRKTKYVRNENRSYYYHRTELFPDKTGRSADFSDNYPCTNKPALKETKDEDCPTILQLETHFRNSTFCLANYLK